MSLMTFLMKREGRVKSKAPSRPRRINRALLNLQFNRIPNSKTVGNLTFNQIPNNRTVADLNFNIGNVISSNISKGYKNTQIVRANGRVYAVLTMPDGTRRVKILR